MLKFSVLSGVSKGEATYDVHEGLSCVKIFCIIIFREVS